MEKMSLKTYTRPCIFPRNIHNYEKNQISGFVLLIPTGNYMLKVNKRNTRTRCEICSKLTTKTPELNHWRRSGVFIVNFELISHLVLVFLLLALSR